MRVHAITLSGVMTDHAGRASRIGVTDARMSKAAAAGRAMILPLALAQFIASYAATNMNVAISSIAADLGTDVAGCRRRSRCSR
jgi:hypothetical protein